MRESFRTCYTTARGQYGLLAGRAGCRDIRQKKEGDIFHAARRLRLSCDVNKFADSIEGSRACCLISHMPGLLLSCTLCAKRLDRTDTVRE